MSGGEIFLWVAIVSSTVVLLGYEIWNIVVVSRDFMNISRKVKEQKGTE